MSRDRELETHVVAHVHHYSATCTWSGSTAGGYEAYDRTHRDRGARPRSSSRSRRIQRSAVIRAAEPRAAPRARGVVVPAPLVPDGRGKGAPRCRRVSRRRGGVMPEDDPPVRVTQIVLRPQITCAARSPKSASAHLGRRGTPRALRREQPQRRHHHRAGVPATLVVGPIGGSTPTVSGDGVGVPASGAAEHGVEDVGPLQVEVGVDLPRVAHAAVDLDAVLALAMRRLAGDHLGPRRRPGARADAGIVEGHAGRVDGAAGQLGARRTCRPSGA